jgi:hypothetical protein
MSNNNMDGLARKRGRNVVEPHAGAASVNTNGGKSPRAHPCGDCGDNAASNARFNEAARGPREAGLIIKP